METKVENSNGQAAVATQSKVVSPLQITKQYFEQDAVRKRFQELLGKKAQGFIVSVLQCVASNDMLAKADPASIYHAAAVAATLDLPLNNALGMAYIVPFNSKQKDGSYKVMAQFQMGYKSFVQLAQRSGQFKTISATPIYEGQLIESNPLTGFRFDFTKKDSDKVVGYASFFQLLNGFEKTLYMTVEELKKHGAAYSQTFKKGYGLWKDNFEAMAIKTVIKLLLSKFAPLSIEMQRAVVMDQALIIDSETEEVKYIDNSTETVDKEAERIMLMIKDAATLEELHKLLVEVKPEQMELYNQRLQELTPEAAITEEHYNLISLGLTDCKIKKEVDLVEASWGEYANNGEFKKMIEKRRGELKK